MQLPARYDHVGSFLRPKYLLEAREQKARGDISPAQLRRNLAPLARELGVELWEMSPLDEDLESVFRYLVGN